MEKRLVVLIVLGILCFGPVSANLDVASSPIVCSFEALQDKNFDKGFVETWLTNLPESERCAIPFGNSNPNWDLQEFSNHLQFCKNQPQPKSSDPITLNSDGNFWEFNDSWKISRNWVDDGLWEYNDYWNSWSWYQKDPNSNLGSGWRTITITQPKQLIVSGPGHLKFILDTSFDENKGCRVNKEKGFVNQSDKLWWSHLSITQTSLNLKVSDYQSLDLNISYKLNNITFRNRCKNNEVYPFWQDSGMHSASAGFSLYFIVSNISSVGDKPQSLFLGTPARFVYVNNTLDGITGAFEPEGLKTGADTWGAPVYNPPIDSGQLSLLQNGDWTSYSVSLMDSLDQLSEFYGLDLSKYAITSFQLITEPYGVGVYEDFEVKDISLIAQTNNQSICDTKGGNPSEWFYSPGYKKSIPNTGWQDVNGEQWYNQGGGWVMRPFYYDVNELSQQSLTCTSFTYTAWTECNSSALQSRAIASEFPLDCIDGNPESLIQQCSPPCILSNWQSSDSSCLSSGTLTRNWTKIGICDQTIGINKISPETLTCNYNPNIVTCTNFTYSNWSECQANGVQSREVLTSLPNACEVGNSILNQECSYVVSNIGGNGDGGSSGGSGNDGGSAEDVNGEVSSNVSGNEGISSVGLNEISLWERFVNWFKGLFSN
jgi:hypothetical protein